MTVTQTELGYLNNGGYLSQPYLSSMIAGSMGMQAEIIIDKSKSVGMQSEATISSQTAFGMQAENTAIGSDSNGMQAQAVITPLSAYGMQAFVSVKTENAFGMQAEVTSNSLSYIGQEGKIVPHYHNHCGGGYLAQGYLSGPYLANYICVIIPMQAEVAIESQNPIGMQAEITIDSQNPIGMQGEITVVDKLFALGMQGELVQTLSIGMQSRIAIYNTTNLRIMCQFSSRGAVTNNWTASSTATGDFDVNNVNTDLVEQTWRSATGVKTGINLDSDSGVVQGVSVDTMVMLGTNLTTSATVNVLCSNDPTFAVVNDTLQFQMSTDTTQYFILPQAQFPLAQSRYFRFVIDDVTNSNTYLEIGTILFGSADIFQGECFTDQIRFQDVDFADELPTEGFTNVANSRALKRLLGLDFRSLDYGKRNFNIMKDLFRTFRTTHKCMWIPTPSSNDQNITDRYAVFGKLSEIPAEQHNNKGPNLTFVDFTVDVDESK